MAYNLDAFEVFVISIPRTRRVAGYVLVVGGLGGVLSYAALVAGATGVAPVTVLGLGAVFVVPALAGGEAIHLLVPSYPRSWGYYLALVSEFLAAVLVPVAFLLGGSWSLLWLALGVAFLNNFEVLVVSDGLGRYPLLGFASAVQPAMMATGLTVVVPRLDRSLVAHLPDVGVLVAVGVGLGLASLFVEWLFQTNVSGVDGLDITSNLVQRTDLPLPMGYPGTPPVQTFAVAGDDRSAVVVAPWVHPGVMEGIGGGRLTRELIRELNGARDAFFFHVPSTHLSDAADPDIHTAVLDAVSEPATRGQASRLVSRTFGHTTFHGRRYDDTRIVFVESAVHADIEVSVFGDVIDPERTLLVDRHVRIDGTDRSAVYRDSEATEELRAALREFLDVLDEQTLSNYRAGHAVDIETDGISLFGLVEDVDDQRTLLLGADQNESPHSLADLQSELESRYDDVLLFTTDTHASVVANRFDPQADLDRARAVVDAASSRVSDAAAGITAQSAPEVDLLRRDYSRLLYSLNIVARVYIVLLGLLYLALVVGLVAL